MVTLCKNPTWSMEGSALDEVESKLATTRDRHSETRLPRQAKPLEAHKMLDEMAHLDGRGGNRFQALVVGSREYANGPLVARRKHGLQGVDEVVGLTCVQTREFVLVADGGTIEVEGLVV